MSSKAAEDLKILADAVSAEFLAEFWRNPLKPASELAVAVREWADGFVAEYELPYIVTTTVIHDSVHFDFVRKFEPATIEMDLVI